MFNQKSVLARLLANENITVQQGNYETAYFDVQSRTLGLPLWKDMGKDVYDMLVGHEVSHALFTPENFFEYEGSNGIPHSWLNIVEDVRIEKLILRKYPGLVGNFKRGYDTLMNGEADLFGIRDKDLSTLEFMDRLNIHSKARDMIEVPFAADELPFVAQVKACETYDDVIKVCQDIQAWLKEKAEDQQDQEADQSQEGDSEGADQEVTVGVLTDDAPEGDGDEEASETPDIVIDMHEDKSGDDGSDDQSEEGDSESQAESGDDVSDDTSDEKSTVVRPGEPESGLMDQEALTETNFNEKASTLIQEGVVYAKGLTREEAYASIVPYSKIAESRREKVKSPRSFYASTAEFPDAEYATFLAETKQVVNLMVKEFEMRKAAWRSLRARESTKGTIDVNKLHKYRYDDQLFKQVSHLADAKNHGMVMLIDYSGSMHNALPGVIRQTLSLLMFCKRVGIPFEVYSFTTIGGSDGWRDIARAKKVARPKVTRVGSEELGLLKLFDSTMSKRDYDEAFRMMFWQTVDTYACRSNYEDLGNTPLNTALMAMQYVISDFREKHRVQKMTFVSLTDGDSNRVTIASGNDLERSPYARKGYAIEVNGKVIDFTKLGYGSSGREVTAALVSEIGKMGVTTLNYFIAGHGYELNGELPRSLGFVGKQDPSFKAKKKEIRDKGVALFDSNAGYDRRFVMPAANMHSEVEDLEVNDDMTVAKIAKAFSKSNGSKKKSKIVTQKFAEMVA